MSFNVLSSNQFLEYSTLMGHWCSKPIDHDSKRIYEDMALALQKPNERVFTQCFVCRDSQGTPRSIALIKIDDLWSKDPKKAKSYLKLAYIATDPQFKGQGAGKFLMNYLKGLSVAQNTHGIYVNAVASAETFYKKAGFKLLATNFSPYNEKHDGPLPMILSKEKIALKTNF